MAAPERFFVLEGMRGICALLVVLRHAAAIVLGVKFEAPLTYLAVDMFFLLSGFVLAHAYEERLRAGTLSLAGFMKLRLVRLYPMYFLGLVFGFVAFVMIAKLYPWERFLAGMFFVPVFSAREPMFPLNMPAWSLFYEMVVGLVYAWIGVRARLRTLLVVTGVLFVMLGFWLFGYHSLSFGSVSADLLPGFMKAGYAFLAGVVLYRVRDLVRVRMPENIGVRSLLAVGLGIGVPCLLLINPGAWEWLVVMAVLLVVFPASVWLASKVKTSHRMVVGAFLALGAMSYPLYALHYAVFPFLNYFYLSAQDVPVKGAAYLAILLVVMGVVAWGMDRYLDRPVRQRLLAWIK